MYQVATNVEAEEIVTTITYPFGKKIDVSFQRNSVSGSFRYFLSNVAILNNCDVLWLRDPCKRTTRQRTVIQDS